MPFSRVYLEITNCCNLACSFCPGTTRRAAFLTVAQFTHLAGALRDQLAVLCDGTVVPCCLDGEGRIPLGNLLAQPLDEILAAEPARSIAAGFALQKRLHPLCRRCGYAQRFR